MSNLFHYAAAPLELAQRSYSQKDSFKPRGFWISVEDDWKRWCVDFIRDEPSGNYLYYIDWSKVAAKHQGIIIAPYCYARRLTYHTAWYYGWDCASGCIWDLKAIQSVEVAQEACA
jgi:hypothetical protein